MASRSSAKKKKKFKLELRKDVDPFNISKYLTLRNFLITAIGLLLYFIFPKYFQAVLLIAIFYPIGQFSVKTSKYVRNLSIEMVTSFSIFLGYVYGWQWGFFYGVVLGTYMWMQTSIKAKTIVSIIATGMAAYFGHLTAIWFPNNFLIAYLVAITMRNVIAFFMFMPFNPMMQNLIYTVSDAFWNTLIMSVFLNILYSIVMLLPG